MLAYDMTEMQNRLENGHAVDLKHLLKLHLDYLISIDSHIHYLRIQPTIHM